MGNLGVPELLIIAFLVLIFFGSKKIPEIAQGMGKGIKEFRKAAKEIQDEGDDNDTALLSAKKASTSCFYCKSPVAADAKFCPSCGKSLEAPNCPKCGTKNKLGDRFCGNCGTAL